MKEVELRDNRLILIIRDGTDFHEIDVTSLWNTFKQIIELNDTKHNQYPVKGDPINR